MAQTSTAGATRRAALPTRQEWILLFLLIGLGIAAHSLSPTFLAPAAQIELSTHIWELALLALPMTLIILTAGIDLRHRLDHLPLRRRLRPAASNPIFPCRSAPD